MNFTDVSLQSPLTLTTSNGLVSPGSQTTDSKPSCKPTPFPGETDKDKALQKLWESHKIDDQGFLIETLTASPLPSLGNDKIQSLADFLKKPRHICCEGMFQIEFTLCELFSYLLQNKQIVEVELVGSGVAWILGDYVLDVFQAMGIENPREFITDQMLADYGRYPTDFDIRIILPHNREDITNYRNAIIDFLAAKASIPPSGDRTVLHKAIIKNGFTKLSPPIINDGNYCLTMGFQDTDGDQFDLILVKQLKRQSLFVQDALRLPLLALVLAINFDLVNGQNVIIPISDFRNGWQAIVDRLTGLLRAIAPDTIDFMGLLMLLSNIVKGKRCSDKSLVTALFNRLREIVISPHLSYLIPPPLQKTFHHLPPDSPNDRFIKAIGYGLEKAAVNHFKNNPRAILFLTLLASLELKQQGFQDDIPLLWNIMSVSLDFKECSDVFSCLANAAQHSGLVSILDLLQTVAFMHLSAPKPAASDTSSLSCHLTTHQGTPTLQLAMEGYHLLLPFTPLTSLKNGIAAYRSTVMSDPLEVLLNKLMPSHPLLKHPGPFLELYTETLTFNLKEIEPLCEETLNSDKLLPWHRLLVDWVIHFRNHFNHPYINSFLEDIFPRYIFHIPETEKRKNILNTLCNQADSEKEHRLYVAMREEMQKNKNEKEPSSIYLSWALSLSATNDPQRALIAFTFWNKCQSRFEKDNAIEWGIQLIHKMMQARPDLAFSLWKSLLTQNITQDKKNALLLWDIFRNQVLKDNLHNVSASLFTLASDLVIKALPEKMEEWLHCFEKMMPFLLAPEAKEACETLLSLFSTDNWIEKSSFSFHPSLLILLRNLIHQLESYFLSHSPSPIRSWELKIAEALAKNCSVEELQSAGPEDSADLLLGFLSAPLTTSSKYLFRDVCRQLILLAPHTHSTTKEKIIRHLTDFLSFLPCECSAEIHLNMVINTHQNLLFQIIENLPVQVQINLLQQFSRHNFFIDATPYAAERCLSSFQAILKNPEDENQCLLYGPFKWLVNHCLLCNYPNNLKQFYFDFLLFLKESLSENDLEPLIARFFDLVEKEGPPCEEMNYIDALMDLHHDLISKKFSISLHILDHLFLIAKDNAPILADTIFKSMESMKTYSPIEMLILLDNSHHYFQKYISADRIKQHYLNLTKVILNSGALTFLELLFVSLSKGYHLSLSNWKLILNNCSGFYPELNNMICQILFADFETLFYENKMEERHHFCMWIINKMGRHHPQVFISLLGFLKTIMDSIDDLSMEDERLELIQTLFLNSLNFMQPQDLNKWLNAYDKALPYLKEDVEPTRNWNENDIKKFINTRLQIKGQLEQMKIMVLAKMGTIEQVREICRNFPKFIQFLNSISFPQKQLYLGFQALCSLPSERKLIFTPLIISSIDNPYYNDLFDFIEELSNTEWNLIEITTFIDSVNQCRQLSLIEAGCQFSLGLLAKYPNRPKNEIAKLTRSLDVFLKKLHDKNAKLPLYFCRYFVLFSTELNPILEKNPLIFKGFLQLFNFTDNSDFLFKLMNLYSPIILKNQELYTLYFQLVVDDLILLHESSPEKFYVVLTKYTSKLLDALQPLYQSKASRRMIMALFNNKITSKFVKSINFDSKQIGHSLIAFTFLIEIRINTEAFDLEKQDEVLHSYLYLPIPDKYPNLQKSHYFKHVPDILKKLTQTKKINKTIHEYLLLTLAKVFPNKPDFGDAFTNMINNLLKMDTAYAMLSIRSHLRHWQEDMLENDKRYRSTKYLECWKKFISHISVSLLSFEEVPIINHVIDSLFKSDPDNPFFKMNKSEQWQTTAHQILSHIFKTLANPNCSIYSSVETYHQIFIQLSEFLFSFLKFNRSTHYHSLYLDFIEQLMEPLEKCFDKSEFDRMASSYFQLIMQSNDLNLTPKEITQRSDLIKKWLEKLKVLNEKRYLEYMYKATDLALLQQLPEKTG